ncbi:MAG: hypothetical protein HBSAPP03_24880 [Phycisphaerae bacterium]|nr:MAG: hypothetical protein HBSAPP03_24880 [Phycisphaerae bacterium]
MAGSGDKGKASATRVRQPTPAILAAPLDKKEQAKVVSASFTPPAMVLLTILDAHTRQPVPGAFVRRLTVEHLEGSGDAGKLVEEGAFQAVETPPSPAPVFTVDDQKALDKAKADAEKGTGSAQKNAVKKRNELIDKKSKWVFFAAHVQGLVKLLGLWKGVDSKYRYTGPADGGGWDDFERDNLAPLYHALRGKPYSSTGKGGDALPTAVKFLRGLIDGMFTTGPDGVLKIIVPVGEKGRITLEMAHMKLLALADAGKMGANPTMTARYARGKNDFAPDAPDSKAELSHWSLASKDHEAALRNFIALDYDATGPDAVKNPAKHSTYAMVWCQPTWFEPPEKTVHFEPRTAAGDASRALVNGRPTLVVSTSTGPHGHWYGSYTDKGRRKDWDWRDTVKELPSGKGDWYVLSARPAKEIKVVWWSASESDMKKEIDEAIKDDQSSKDFMPVFNAITRKKTFNSKDYKPGKEPTIDIISTGKKKLTKEEMDGPFHVVLEMHLNYEGPMSFEDAVLKGLENVVPNQDLLTKMPDGRWKRKLPRADETQEDPEYFSTLEAALVNFKIPKMHHGIDCASNVGDPVFATCGGKLLKSGKVTYNNSGSAAGLVASVQAWRTNTISLIQCLHMATVSEPAGAKVKAGDVIGTMGRTGNPNTDSPTHAHFQCGKSLESCILPGYETIFPHNNQPKLLPCGADWWSTSKSNTTPPNDLNEDPTRPKKCRAIPAHRSNKVNMVPGSCWAVREGVCPHGMTLSAWREIKAKDAQEAKEAKEKEAKEKKEKQEQEKKASKDKNVKNTAVSAKKG